MLDFPSFALKIPEPLNGHFGWACAKMKEVTSQFLVKIRHNLPKPENHRIVWHVAFVGSVSFPILDIDILFSAEHHLEFMRFKNFKVVVRYDLVKSVLQSFDDFTNVSISIKFYPMRINRILHEANKFFLVFIIYEWVFSSWSQLILFFLVSKRVHDSCRESDQIVLGNGTIPYSLQGVVKLNIIKIILQCHSYTCQSNEWVDLTKFCKLSC